MQAVEHLAFISVEEYLAGELKSQIRHEYIGGQVYAMAGVSRRHNILCKNLVIALDSHLRGGPCETFFVDFKVRLRIAEEDIFYYPDVMVTCDPRDTEEYYNRFPKVLIEILSPGTERIDRHEKLSSYTQLESLEEYVLVAQERIEVTVLRRANHWRPEVANRPEQQLRIPSLDFSRSLPAIYESVLPAA